MRRKSDRWFRQGKHRQNRRLVLSIMVIIIFFAGVAWNLYSHGKKSWSWVVGNQTILIDAGHGGVDPGAVGKNNTLEKDITLAVSKRLKILVEQGGGKAIMVREEDVDLGAAQGLLKRKREDLAQRIQLAEEAKADVYLSIHANSFPNEKLTGAQVFYYTDSAEGKLLAQCLQEQLNLVAGGKRAAKGNKELFILKRANRAAVTIEIGFLSNVEEEQKLNDPKYQQQLAVAVYQGLANYLGKGQNAILKTP